MPENTAAVQEPTAQAGTGFVPITTQEQFDEAIKARLNRERAKYAGYEEYKAKAAEYEQYKATAEQSKAATGTELDSVKQQLAAAQAEIAGYKAKAERDAWNMQVAQESGLPVSLIADFGADSLDELKAKATRAAQAVKVPAVPYDPADRKPNAAAPTDTKAQLMAALAPLMR